MRHFLASGPVTPLALSVSESPPAAPLVAPPRGTQPRLAGGLGTTPGTVDVAPVAIAADHHLAGGNERSDTDVLCSPSAKKADEDLIIGRKREIVTRSCTARPVGCGVGVIATIRDPASHLLSTAFPIYPFTRLLSPVPADSGLGRKLLADSFAIYARVLEAIYTRVFSPEKT